MLLQGKMITGEFDPTVNEFSLQKVKQFDTETILNESQIHRMYQYLKKQQHEASGQIITLNDQVLVNLSQDELNELLLDMEKVMSMYH